jgi:dTDP-4-dehydrorhamnose reductase
MKGKILLTGKSGQIGAELISRLRTLGETLAPDRHEMDLSSPDSVRQIIRAVRPALIINAAAYTDVGKAEEEETQARAINTDALALMAEEGKKCGSALVHFSTDYVFDGTKNCPYDELDLPNPVNVYGKTKLAGEQAIQRAGIPHLIIRTSWVYGLTGRNFLMSVLRLATERDELKFVNDQIGAPTWCRQIAMAATQIVTQLSDGYPDSMAKISGVYHMTAAGKTNRFEFAKTILEEASRLPQDTPWFPAATQGRPKMTRRVIPVTTEDYSRSVRRPAYSVLSNARIKRILGIELPDWRAQLHQAFTSRQV